MYVSAASDTARSALRSEADMRGTLGHVRLGPQPDSCSAATPCTQICACTSGSAAPSEFVLRPAFTCVRWQYSKSCWRSPFRPQGIDKKPDLPMRFLCTRAKARATRALDVDAARSALRSEADMRGTLGHVRLGRIRGRVAGTAEAAAAVAEAAPKKSVMACVNTLAASAACWIA